MRKPRGIAGVFGATGSAGALLTKFKVVLKADMWFLLGGVGRAYSLAMGWFRHPTAMPLALHASATGRLRL